jgi:hypothetical protein
VDLREVGVRGHVGGFEGGCSGVRGHVGEFQGGWV